MREVLEKIHKEILEEKELKSNKVVFPSSEYESVAFSTDNFHPISSVENSNEGLKNLLTESQIKELKETKIAFVDGGNSVILETPSVCVQLIRLCFNIYVDNKKVNSGKHEFFTLTKSKNVHGKIFYETKIFAISNSLIPNETDLQFDASDQTISQGKSFAEISQVGSYARRFGELMLALDLCKTLDSGDIVVLDGTLQAKITGERKYLDTLYSGAKEKEIVVCALAKTSRLFTDSGDDAISAVSRMAKKIKDLKSWYYNPTMRTKSEDHRVEMYFVKLCSSSPYCFRFETSLDINNDKINSLFTLLSMQSRDGVFMGYPYGLIDVDQSARISNEEKFYLKTVFGVRESDELAVNAHSKLDTVRF